MGRTGSVRHLAAAALADYIGRFVGAAADMRPLLSIPIPGVALALTPRSVVALSAIALLTAIHVRGLGPGRLVQNLLAGVKVCALVTFVAIGFAIGHGNAAHLTQGGDFRASGF